MDKHTQRREIRSRINKLDPIYCQTADAAIYRHILSLPDYQQASCIFCYISVDKEVNTRPLIEHAWITGKQVVVPKCTGRGIMELFEIHSYDDLEPGYYGILEPRFYCIPVLPSSIQFAVIPCLSCDRQKNRLGHGGGYYDRYLEHTSFTTAAICREKILLEHVCCEPHDQPVNMVITEKRIY